MNSLSELRTTVQSDLNVGDESSLYTPTAIDLAINRAYRKAGGLFPWPELMDAKKQLLKLIMIITIILKHGGQTQFGR